MHAHVALIAVTERRRRRRRRRALPFSRMPSPLGRRRATSFGCTPRRRAAFHMVVTESSACRRCCELGGHNSFSEKLPRTHVVVDGRPPEVGLRSSPYPLAAPPQRASAPLLWLSNTEGRALAADRSARVMVDRGRKPHQPAAARRAQRAAAASPPPASSSAAGRPFDLERRRRRATGGRRGAAPAARRRGLRDIVLGAVARSGRSRWSIVPLTARAALALLDRRRLRGRPSARRSRRRGRRGGAPTALAPSRRRSDAPT